MDKTLPGTVIHPEVYPPEPPSTYRPLTYLACPYSHPSETLREARYRLVTKAAAWLIKNRGWNVFSPITHSHPLATIGDCSGDWDSWAKVDREYLSVSCRMVVLCLPGWSKSTGVNAELNIARAHGLSVMFMQPTSGGYEFVLQYQALDAEVLGEPPLAGVLDPSMPTKVPDGMDNPKDLIGMTKPPLRLVPATALLYFAQVMAHGAKKYGPYNWRQKAVRYTVYLEAAMRHILAALDGEENDPESGQPHTAHAGACMAIILDAKSINKLIDDRPTPGAAAHLISEMTQK